MCVSVTVSMMHLFLPERTWESLWGALGADAAIEAADIVLMEDELPKIVDAVSIAKETVRVVGQNINFALVMKFIVLVLAAVGYISMWEAVFTDVA